MKTLALFTIFALAMSYSLAEEGEKKEVKVPVIPYTGYYYPYAHYYYPPSYYKPVSSYSYSYGSYYYPQSPYKYVAAPGAAPVHYIS
ncbi:hypothetical protein X975_19328, partial [Stegodyphus mimosarum]